MSERLSSCPETSPPLAAGRALLCGTMLLVVAASGSGAAADESSVTAPDRFRPRGALLDGSADWVSLDIDRVAFGSDRFVTVAAVRPAVSLETRLELDAPVVQGIVARENLFVVERVGESESLAVFRLGSEDRTPSTVRMHPEPRSKLHLAQMDDYLLVAEDGHGVRILELPHHRHDEPGHHALRATELPAVGFFPLPESIVAVAASLRTIYVATDRDLVVVDGSNPALPGFVGRVRLDTRVQALAANGPTVYLLGDDGLRLRNLSKTDRTSDVSIYPEVRGRSLALAGRTVYVADAATGVREFQDLSARAATFFVAVGDVFFNPAGVVNVTVGDTVEWQKPTTVFTHNVFSCNASQTGCGGASSNETFSSGTVTTSPFNFSHTFTLAGSNPYVCQSHAFSMQGDINVAAGPTAPPTVSDGTGGSLPMTVGKLDGTGSDLSIQYDTSCPDAAGHDILYGFRGQLPTVLGGTYGPSGGSCSVGTTSPATWSATPAPAAGDFLWWVIVADDGSATEGSWGTDGLGGERDGPGPNGASGLCANTDKNVTNACGQ